MIMKYNIKVNITPVPASRPRVTRYGVYYGKNHTQYIKDVAKQGFRCTPCKPKTPLTGLLSVKMVYHIPLAKNTSKKNKLEKNKKPCEKHVDLDNLTKLFWDCVLVDGKIIADDSQIVSSSSKKIWTSDPIGFTECIFKEL